jgi:ubiquinone/menaquinone biosynthesis C-methylase UbiE
MKIGTTEYGAKTAYNVKGAADNYEELRFSGFLGRYRFQREQKAIRSIVNPLPEGISVLDCPCGTGRWWPILAAKASSIVAVDISDEMLGFARERSKSYGISIRVERGDAERLQMEDGSVDYVFSHALTKHLPVPVQYQVLAEFARVARLGVICSFGIFTPLTYQVWRWRHLKESYPLELAELKRMARAAGLEIEARIPCTTPVGVEHTVRFKKLRN